LLFFLCSRLASALRGTRAQPPAVAHRCVHASVSRPSSDQSERTREPPRAFDPALLDFLVCPFSKKPLRYEASPNELINEELEIAYPIIDGIPNMIPQAARMTHQNKKKKWSSIRSYLKTTTHTTKFSKYHPPFKKPEWGFPGGASG
uniref:Protein preY, mitochondrial n=1 Tax=Phocoena sinus TaxID=42100 RepID=A0A8C9BV59_PHOSS